MPFNGSGTFTPIPAPDFPAVPGTVISSSAYNAVVTDIVTNGLTNCVTRDGQSPPTVDLPMAGHKLTGVSAGSADTDGAQLGQTLAVRGQVGAVDWNSRNTTGVYEATAASFALPATNYPPTTALGQLFVTAQGALVTQFYVVSNTIFLRQSISAVWGVWAMSGGSSGANLLVNGGLRIWQSTVTGGASLASGTGKRYFADMVYQDSIGSTYSATQEVFAAGADAPDVGAQYFLKTIVASVAGAGNYHTVSLPVEDVRSLAGKQVTLSFWVLGTVTQDISISVLQNFGTGGSPSTAVDTYVGKATCTTSWSRVSLTFTVPAITGKTIGTADGSFQVFKLWTDAGSNFNTQTSTLGQHSGTYSFSCFKLEFGAIASAFVYPPQSQEWDNCSRYYVGPSTTAGRSGVQVNWSGIAAAGSLYHTTVATPVPMRIAPTVTYINFQVFNFATTPDSIAPSKDHVYYIFTATAAGNTSQYSGFHTLDARI